MEQQGKYYMNTLPCGFQVGVHSLTSLRINKATFTDKGLWPVYVFWVIKIRQVNNTIKLVWI